MKKTEKGILIVNDDGIYGAGLKPLAQKLKPLGKVTIVVPEQERSAASHSVTFHKPIRVRQLNKSTFIMNGTPADCVRFSVLSLLKGKLDVIVSGINRGANMGADTLYSGTVGAAEEGCLLGISSIAVSLVVNSNNPQFSSAADFAKIITKQVLASPLPKNRCLNVNVPDLPKKQIKGVSTTHLGRRVYGKKLQSRVDPRGGLYFWMAGETPQGLSTPGSDLAAVEAGKISVTPLQLDMTDLEMIKTIHHWNLSFGGHF